MALSIAFHRDCGLFRSLFEELFVSDVFAYFHIVLETAEFYYALKQWIFRIVEALFVIPVCLQLHEFLHLFLQKGFDRSPACRQHTLLCFPNLQPN